MCKKKNKMMKNPPFTVLINFMGQYSIFYKVPLKIKITASSKAKLLNKSILYWSKVFKFVLMVETVHITI